MLGQDLETGADGVFRIARRVAKDRVISTVDPDTRHGHKTSARGFDGYKGHAAVDPDSEIITATTVTPGNAGDASAAADLIADLLDDDHRHDPADEPASRTRAAAEPSRAARDRRPSAGGGRGRASGRGSTATTPTAPASSTSGSREAGIESRCKTQAPTAAGGRFSKDRFDIDLDAGTVTCPAGVTAPIRPARAGGGTAYFGSACPAARCARSAPPPPAGARSPSARTSRPSPTPAPARPTPPGSPTTAPPDPRSNASSPT